MVLLLYYCFVIVFVINKLINASTATRAASIYSLCISSVAAYSYLKSSSSFLFSCDKVSHDSISRLRNHLQVVPKL